MRKTSQKTSRSLDLVITAPLATKFIVGCLVLLASALIATNALMTYGLPSLGFPGIYSEERAKVVSNLELVADLKKERLKLWIQERREDVIILTESAFVQSATLQIREAFHDKSRTGKPLSSVFEALQQEPAFLTLRGYIKDWIKLKENYSGIKIVDPGTRVVMVSTNREDLGEELTDLPSLGSKNRAENSIWFELKTDPTTGKHLLRISSPIKAESWELEPGVYRTDGVLVLYVSIEDIMEPLVYTGMGLGRTGEIVVANEVSKTIVTPRLADTKKSGPAHEVYSINTEQMNRALRGEEGTLISLDYRGVEVLAAYRSIELNPFQRWGLVVKVDEAETQAPAKRLQLFLALVFLSVLITGSALAYWMTRRITAPIRSLTRIAKSAQSGNLDVRAPFRGKDEVGVLSGSFNSLLDTIETWRRDLESKVKQRTSDLTSEIAERKQAEESLKSQTEQLIHAQKMEAVGTLAGGIAHDFNNILLVITGYCELILMSMRPADQHYASVEVIQKAAFRAADLVKQMLTFSRASETNPQPIRLNHQVEDEVSLLDRTIPKTIKILMDLEPELKMINADPTQIDQIVLNLAINARDAMPAGGTLTLRTRNIILNEEYCETNLEVRPGEYVEFAISDTGTGMEKCIQERIFEPFFTTKDPGSGTGLGLSMVFGIIKAHGGHITCLSEPGAGTTFSIYFPVAEDIREAPDGSRDSADNSGNETILIVDDEEMIRNFAGEMLEMLGYTVMKAENGLEALDIYAQQPDKIDLVVLDLNMPVMNGVECLEGMAAINPKIKALIATGYWVDAQTKKKLAANAKGLVSKPFKAEEFLGLLRSILDRD
jgi:signal transduction histidine kinase/ActR/RegA family two-component response regulator